MSTIEILSTGYRAARAAARKTAQERDETRRRRGRLGTLVVEHGLTLAGLSCFTAAAAMVAIPLGLAVAGAAFFILELRAGD